MIRQRPWNKCQDCGRFIAYEEFVDGTAVHKIVAPSSLFSDERYETYHLDCGLTTKATESRMTTLTKDQS